MALQSTAKEKPMEQYTVTMVPSDTKTRLLLMQGPDELMRAALPAPWQIMHQRTVATFLEGLSLWLDARLRVVLCAGASDSTFSLGLSDEMGNGSESVFFAVEVVPRRALRRQANRLGGVADFKSLRQLSLLSPKSGGMP